MLTAMTERSQSRDRVEEGDLLDLVLWREREIGRRMAAIDEHQQMLAIEVLPALSARRDELARAEQRLRALTRMPAPDPSVAALTRERDAAYARVSALTSSWSWRVTAPARRIYDWYLAVSGRTAGAPHS
jgi:hypothetical protein